MSQASEQTAKQLANAANVQRIWKDVIVNIKEYGAKSLEESPNFDSTVAIQTAINYAIAHGKSDIWIPPGTYKYTTLSNTANIAFYGDSVSLTGSTVLTLTSFKNMITRINNIIASAGNSNTEIVDARQPQSGAAFITLKTRLDSEFSYTNIRIDNLVANAGSGNAEVVDARVNNKGVIYYVLKSRLDATDSQVALKANQSYVDQQITTIGSATPKGTFATLTALQAAFPSGTTGIYVVTGDGNWYYWNGTAWTVGGVYQATGLPDDVVTAEKALFISKSANKFNNTDPEIIQGSFLSQTGVVTAAAGYYISHKIYVNPGDQITVRYIEQQGGGFYDRNNNFLSKIGTPSGTASPYTFSAPANAYYFKFNGRTTFIDQDMVVSGSTYPGTYIPFSRKLSNKISVDTASVPVIGKDKASFVVQSSNKFNKNDPTIQVGKYITTGGAIATAADYIITHMIPVKYGDVIRRNIPNNEALGGGLYDENGSFLALIPAGTLTSGVWSYTVNNTVAKYAALNIHWSAGMNVDNLMVTVNEAMPASYVAFFYKLDETFDFNDRQKAAISGNILLYGKIGLYEGDSICYGAGYVGGYPKIIGENNNMSTVNYGVAGATIAAGTIYSDTGTNRHWICRSVSAMQASADYIIFQGGINDYWNGVPLGTITSDYTSTLDDTTFAGALESLFKQAQLKWPGKKMGFIITHKVYTTYYPNPDSTSKAFENYRTMILKVCDKWSVPYIDLYMLSGLNYGLADIRTAYSKDADGCHPNEAGYRQFLVPKLEAWMKSL